MAMGMIIPQPTPGRWPRTTCRRPAISRLPGAGLVFLVRAPWFPVADLACCVAAAVHGVAQADSAAGSPSPLMCCAVAGHRAGRRAAGASSPAASGDAAARAPRSVRHRPGAGRRGGARGAAHVGVLKVLEELACRSTRIAGRAWARWSGASMPAASALARIEAALTSATCRTRSATGRRAPTPVRRKTEDQNFLVRFRRAQGRRIQAAQGPDLWPEAQQILRRLTLPVAAARDFDDLPTPFRAVADPNLETRGRGARRRHLVRPCAPASRRRTAHASAGRTGRAGAVYDRAALGRERCRRRRACEWASIAHRWSTWEFPAHEQDRSPTRSARSPTDARDR